MQDQEAIPLKPQVSQTTGDLAFCSPVVSTFLPSSLLRYVSLSQLGWIRHSTTMLANGHTTAKSRRPLCIISKASSYHEKTSCKPLELEKLSFRCSQVKAPLPTGVATPQGAAMPAVKKAGTPGLACRHRLALFASHLATRQTTGAKISDTLPFPYNSW